MKSFENIFVTLLSVSISLSCLKASGQKPIGIPADSTEAVILKIRQEYSKIKSDSIKYRVVHQDVWSESTEGGEIVRYLDGKQLIKMISTFYGEMGNNVAEYYFSDDKLFFCYQRYTAYNKPMYAKDMRILKVEENRYYLNNLKLIRWVISNGKIADKKLYPAKRKEVMEEVKHLLSLKPEAS